MTLSLGTALTSSPVTTGRRGPRIPFGFVLLTDVDGSPLSDAGGHFLLERI